MDTQSRIVHRPPQERGGLDMASSRIIIGNVGIQMIRAKADHRTKVPAGALRLYAVAETSLGTLALDIEPCAGCHDTVLGGPAAEAAAAAAGGPPPERSRACP
eukprot:6750906-Pyramimonas_sp.AAC.1